MKMNHFISLFFLVLLTSYSAFADRPLERAEILQVFEKLTSQPRDTWIPAGTIHATHKEYRAPEITDPIEIKNRIREEIAKYQNNPDKPELTEELRKLKLDAIPFNTHYRLSNKYTMSSTVIVKFDGNRFYWEINVDSRKDSVKPSRNLEGNFMTDQFNLEWNARRIFVWDGEKYATYFLPGNQAIVDTTGSKPHVVKGPLTAGIITWGYGYYSCENLTAADSSAVEKYVDGRTQVHLTLNNPDGLEMFIVMDPAKDYAVLSCRINGSGNEVISKRCAGYQLVSGNWVPTIILIERYEAGSNRLLSRDIWNITSISTDVPEGYNFDVGYENSALIEYYSSVTDNSVMYRHSNRINTDRLLAERLTFAANEGLRTQNCATAALKYALSQLGKDVTDRQLAQLVDGQKRQTSLYSMKRFVQWMGLYCRVVKTDIQTLESLDNCEVILHIPGKKHFVVLEAIDDSYVWSIDLTSNKFYYRTDIDFFGMDWTEGTALLISKQPIRLRGDISDIASPRLAGIIGAAGYSCSNPIQAPYVVSCTEVGGGCWGVYQQYHFRLGCKSDVSGSCTSSKMIRYDESPCIDDLWGCTITGDWNTYFMRACGPPGY